MIGGLLVVAFGVLLFAVFAPFFRDPVARVMYLTVAASFIFWYWLPSLNLLTVGYVGVANFLITPSVSDACLITLGAEICVLFAMLAARPFIRTLKPELDDIYTWPHLGAVTFAIAFGFLFVKFLNEGFGVFVELATGLVSARELQSYENLSSGATQSLLALVEIVGIVVGLLALARHAYLRSLSSVDGVLTAFGLALLFLASGTRTVVIQAVLIIWLVRAIRPRQPGIVRAANPFRLLLAAAGIVAVLGVATSAFVSRFSNDAGYANAGAVASVADMLIVNNDMMRELAFSIDTMQPDPSGAEDFALVPFTYMMPRFLGFEKNIPIHLISYNYLRLGIDLNSSEGNAFPGIVADFWLLFGNWGSVIFAMFVVTYLVLCSLISSMAKCNSDQMAYVTVVSAFLFFGFRNITGALALIFVVAFMVIFMVKWISRRAPTRGAVSSEGSTTVDVERLSP